MCGPWPVHGCPRGQDDSSWCNMYWKTAITMKLFNKRVCWFSDNQNVVRMLHVGSKKAELKEVGCMGSFSPVSLIPSNDRG